MKQVAWSSQRYNSEMGGAIYLMCDGREVEICEVALVRDDFVWPPKVDMDLTFHVDDKFDREAPSMWRWGDLVFEGEAVKFLRSSAKAAVRHAEENAMMNFADDFGLMEE